jgi:DNA-binding XRE family transcriptional regulator
MKRLGEQVADCRKKRGMGEQWLADALGISLAGLRQIERGEVETPMWLIGSITDALSAHLLLGAGVEGGVSLTVSDVPLDAQRCPVESAGDRCEGLKGHEGVHHAHTLTGWKRWLQSDAVQPKPEHGVS